MVQGGSLRVIEVSHKYLTLAAKKTLIIRAPIGVGGASSWERAVHIDNKLQLPWQFDGDPAGSVPVSLSTNRAARASDQSLQLMGIRLQCFVPAVNR